MEIPKKISPCPIIESIVEIRFSSRAPSEAIFGIIYNEFKDEFPNLEKLPILQIPDQLRENDPNLRFRPTHKLSNNNLMIQVGPQVFALVNVHEYLGWEMFSEHIYRVFSKLFTTIKFEKLIRIAVRYINLFKGINIFEHSNMKIALNDEPFTGNEINFTSVINADDCINRLVMLNKSEVVVDKSYYSGSVIDIDTVLKSYPENITSNVEILKKCIEKAHVEEKKLFFSLIQQSFLNTLNPEY